jgi:nucleoid DNA-binding protein
MAKSMTKSAIIGHVAQKTTLSKKQVNDVMDTLLALAQKEAKNVFVLPNFGRLVPGRRAWSAIPRPANPSRSRPSGS